MLIYFFRDFMVVQLSRQKSKLTDEDTFFEDLAKSESEGKKFNPYENMTS